MEEVKDPQKSNFKILEILEDYLYNNPEVTFCKALKTLGINRKEILMGMVDNELESSKQTLERVLKRKLKKDE